MIQESDTYYIIDREQWQKLGHDSKITLTSADLRSLQALNDTVSLTDVREVYIPLIKILDIHFRAYLSRQSEVDRLLNKDPAHETYVIGIAGGVAVGKSTLARLLQTILDQYYKEKKVDLITTDGFLYPNAVLKKKNLMNRKGFPESYDMDRLVTFMADVKSGRSKIKVPKYSHDIYDIVSGEYTIIDRPDILIVEGINTLQLPANEKIYASDFFDFTFFVDANPTNIAKWYMDRFRILVDTSFRDPKNYYSRFATQPLDESLAYAEKVWTEINEKNLEEFILPTRFRADIILHKTTDHFIDQILLRKH